ncbi:hypothetical protein [Pseudacidovorax sp. NFM-22]|uniref:hypothetical protein n=1 Tax=Pseudacidovorax sp. NFM-22 TaxID=2744469 RepID=UPI001F2DBA02|nr:hypothetical protein [Pseudacidovorax sp. NFM-22]
MTPDEKQKAWEEFQVRQRAAQAIYDSFRYTEAQRERLLDFIGAAMKVIRGDAPFEMLSRLVPIKRQEPAIVSGQAYRGGTEFTFNACFLNQWTSLYMLGTTDEQGKVEPYHFQIELGPSMRIERDRLEKLLQLKVVPGWTAEGGNLRPPGFVILRDGSFHEVNDSTFAYDVLDAPVAPYEVKVEFNYLHGPTGDPRTAVQLSRLEIRRDYRTPTQLRKREADRPSPTSIH